MEQHKGFTGKGSALKGKRSGRRGLTGVSDIVLVADGGMVHHEQELLTQKYVSMLKELRLVLQKLKWERQRVITMLRIAMQSILAAGAGQRRFVACRCKVFKLRNF